MTEPVPERRDGLAITSLVLAIVGLFTFAVPSIVAVILGHIAKSKIRQFPAIYGGAGMATAGLIIGYITIGLLVLWLGITLFGGLWAYHGIQTYQPAMTGLETKSKEDFNKEHASVQQQAACESFADDAAWLLTHLQQSHIKTALAAGGTLDVGLLLQNPREASSLGTLAPGMATLKITEDKPGETVTLTIINNTPLQQSPDKNGRTFATPVATVFTLNIADPSKVEVVGKALITTSYRRDDGSLRTMTSQSDVLTGKSSLAIARIMGDAAERNNNCYGAALSHVDKHVYPQGAAAAPHR